MDFNAINQLARAEEIEIRDDAPWLIAQLNLWLDELFEMFGEVAYE